MKIILEQIDESEEEQIIVKSHRMRPELLQSLNLIADAKPNGRDYFFALSGEEIFRVNPSDILYIESVDGKTFMYCSERVYESKQKLREFEELLKEKNFLRSSRTMIINVDKVRSFSPAAAGQLRVTMLNGEKVLITRRYANAVKAALGIYAAIQA